MKQTLWKKVIEEYFAECDATRVRIEQKNGSFIDWQRPYTLYGLCAALQMSEQEVLSLKDGHGSKSKCRLIRTALSTIAAYTLEHALLGDLSSPIAIAAIKELALIPEQTEHHDGMLVISMDSQTREAAQ